MESCIPNIDTIVVKKLEEFLLYFHYEKHVVYLGKETVAEPAMDKYFWSREKQISRITAGKVRVSDIDIPIIISTLNEKYNVIMLLSELKNCFYRDGYNIYTMSNKVECVLYDMEFLPEELCNNYNKTQIHNFLYWQTYYNQNDAILFGTNNSLNSINFEDLADIVIEMYDVSGKIGTKVYCNGKLETEEMMDCINSKTVGKLYQNILKFFADYFSNRNYAEILNNLNPDINNMTSIADESVFFVVTQAFSMLGGLFLLYHYKM